MNVSLEKTCTVFCLKISVCFSYLYVCFEWFRQNTYNGQMKKDMVEIWKV